MLPQVQVNFQNGNLGQQALTADGVFGIVTQGVAVGDTLALAKAYVVYSLADIVALGVTANADDANAALYKLVKDFYNNASNGTELWIYVLPQSLLLSDMVDKNQPGNAVAFLKTAKGRLRALFVGYNPESTYAGTTDSGMDDDVALAITNAQSLAEWAAQTLYAPIFIALEGYNYQGDPTKIADLTTMSNNRVGVLIGDTVSGSKNATLGTLAGRAAANPLQNKVARVKDGPVASATMYIGATPVELADVASLDAKGYISFMTYPARTGYFFIDDWTATLPTDDYNHIVFRRTIDKACRVTYDTLLDGIQDTIPVNADGTVQAAYAHSWEAAIEQAVGAQMTAYGQLSPASDGTDNGCIATVDLTKNIIAGNPFTVAVAVRPFGYDRLIVENLGFPSVS